MAYVEADGVLRDPDWLSANAAKVTRLRASGRDLVELPPALPICNFFRLFAAPQVGALPDLPAATHVHVSGCPSLPFLASRPSSQGNIFAAVHARGAWKICVGTKAIGIGGLRVRWGAGTNPRKPDGNAEALRIAEEVWRSVLRAHPEAAADEIDDSDAFYRSPFEVAMSFGLF